MKFPSAGSCLIMRIEEDPMDRIDRLQVHTDIHASRNDSRINNLLRSSMERVTVDEKTMISN